MIDKSGDLKNLRLNYISIQLPEENWVKTERSIQKLDIFSSVTSRPCSAQTSAIIHSSPQYQSSIKNSKASRGLIFSKYLQNPFKDQSRAESIKNSFAECSLKRYEMKSEGSLRINSIKFKVNSEETKLSPPSEKQKLQMVTFAKFQDEINKKIPLTLKALWKNKSEFKLKKKIIEIPRTDSPKIRRVSNGKIIRNAFKVRTEKRKKDNRNLVVIGSRKKNQGINTN